MRQQKSSELAECRHELRTLTQEASQTEDERLSQALEQAATMNTHDINMIM